MTVPQTATVSMATARKPCKVAEKSSEFFCFNAILCDTRATFISCLSTFRNENSVPHCVKLENRIAAHYIHVYMFISTCCVGILMMMPVKVYVRMIHLVFGFGLSVCTGFVL